MQFQVKKWILRFPSLAPLLPTQQQKKTKISKKKKIWRKFAKQIVGKFYILFPGCSSYETSSENAELDFNSCQSYIQLLGHFYFARKEGLVAFVFLKFNLKRRKSSV